MPGHAGARCGQNLQTLMQFPDFAGPLLLLGLCMLSQPAAAQSEQDCPGAIPVCQSVYTQADSYVNTGQVADLPPGVYCTSEEYNSVWYTFTAAEDGLLGFLITPNRLADDYDWSVWDLTDNDCGDIFNGTAPQLSCNAAGGPGCNGLTGATGDSGEDDQGAGCFFGNSPFNDFIPMQAGHTYVLLINNWTGSSFGYTLDFTQSTGIGIFDEDAPSAGLILFPDSCGQDALRLRFSEQMDCSTLNTAAFALTGPGGPYSLSPAQDPCAGNGGNVRELHLLIDPPLQSLGDFMLQVQAQNAGQLLDLCGNQLPDTTFTFSADRADDGPADLLPDRLELCRDSTLTLAPAEAAGTYTWSDGSTGAQLTVSNPGWYRLSVTGDCGTVFDSCEVIGRLPPPTFSLGPDTALCSGQSLLLAGPADPELNYQWSTGATTADLLVSTGDQYSLSISNACGVLSDDISVQFDPPVAVGLGPDTFLCRDSRLLIDLAQPGALFYEWENGSALPQRTLAGPGDYAVTITGRCNTVSDSIRIRPCEECKVYLPTAFSPNDDGINDLFGPFSDCNLQEAELRIYDRWGGLLHQSGPAELPRWNGRSNDNRAAGAGTYLYQLSYLVEENGRRQRRTAEGVVMLVR